MAGPTTSQEYMKIESISYKHGMLKKLSHKKRLRATYFTGVDGSFWNTGTEEGISAVQQIAGKSA